MSDFSNIAGTLSGALPNLNVVQTAPNYNLGGTYNVNIPNINTIINQYSQNAAGTYQNAVPGSQAVQQAPGYGPEQVYSGPIVAVQSAPSIPTAPKSSLPEAANKLTISTIQNVSGASVSPVAALSQAPATISPILATGTLSKALGGLSQPVAKATNVIANEVVQVTPSTIQFAESVTPEFNKPAEVSIEKISEIAQIAQTASPEKLALLAAQTQSDLDRLTSSQGQKDQLGKDLAAHNPAGEYNGDNAIIENYCTWLIPAIDQGMYDPAKLASGLRAMEQEQIGSISTGGITSAGEAIGWEEPISTAPFNQDNLAGQKQRLVQFSIDNANRGLDGTITGNMIASIVSTVDDAGVRKQLSDYVTNGGLERDIRNDPAYAVETALQNIMTSPTGQFAIGAAFVAVSVASGGTTSGLGGVAKGIGMAPMMLGKVKSLMSVGDNLGIQALNTANNNAKQQSYSYTSTDSVLKDALSTTQYDMKNIKDPVERQDRLNELKDKIDNQTASLAGNMQYLMYTGQWDDEVTKLKGYKDQYDNLVSGVLSGQPNLTPTPNATGLIKPPPGGQVVIGNVAQGVDVPAAMDFGQTSGTLTFRIINAAGEDLGTQYLSYKPGTQAVADFTSAKSKAEIAAENVKPHSDTILIPAGYSGVIKTAQGGFAVHATDYDRTIDSPIMNQGDNYELVLANSANGGTIDKSFTLGSASQSHIVAPYVTTQAKESTGQGVVDLNFTKTQQVTIDNQLIDPKHYGSGLMLTQGYHHVTVLESGKDPVEKDFFVQSDSEMAVALQGQATKEYGGGGSSGGGGGGYSPAEKPTSGQIVFGVTFQDADIWLDNVQIAPVLGQAYEISQGYHAVKAQKHCMQDFNKTVYITAGQALNVDAAFVRSTSADCVASQEPVVKTLTATKGDIKFTFDMTGCTIYIDDVIVHPIYDQPIEYDYGYHSLKITKDGYDDWLKDIYISSGDVITVVPVLTLKQASTGGGVSTTQSSTSKRVFINTTPTGAKIMIGNMLPLPEGTIPDLNGLVAADISMGFTGDWTPGYVDLEAGLYKVTTSKSGYTDKTHIVYVGDVIAFDAQAIALARNKGLI